MTGDPALRVGTLRRVESTGSTNDDAFALLESGAAVPVLVTAEEQTAGRGRRGNSWLAPAGTCLQLSWGFSPELAAEDLPLLSPACAVAIAQAVADVTGRAAQVKWPNDVFLDGSKCAGVLLESRTIGDRLAVVAGVGLNVNVEPSWFLERDLVHATSLLAVTGRTQDRDRLLVRIVDRLEETFAAVVAGRASEVQHTFDAMSYLTGREVTLQCGDEVVTGLVKGIKLDEGLFLDVAGEPRVLEAAYTHVLSW